MSHLAHEILVPYLDGELSSDEAHRCRHHLAACRTCQAEAEALGGVWDLLDEVPEPGIPDGLAAAVLARAADELAKQPVDHPRVFRHRLIRWAAPLAAAAAIALVVLLPRDSGVDPNLVITNDPIVSADDAEIHEIPQSDIEQILKVRDSLDVMNEYGDLIEHYDVLKRLDRILQDENATL